MDYTDLLEPKVIQPKKPRELRSPAGFSEASTKKSTVQVKKEVDLEQLKVKKIWEIAIGPAKSIPMNLIMSYMTGNSLQIIPIMMTFSLFFNPLMAIFNETNKIFKNLETDKNTTVVLQAKAVFILCQLGCMAIGVWKLNGMGLIPNSDADWLSFKNPILNPERITLI